MQVISNQQIHKHTCKLFCLIFKEKYDNSLELIFYKIATQQVKNLYMVDNKRLLLLVIICKILIVINLSHPL